MQTEIDGFHIMPDEAYIIFFVHKESNNIIFLACTADIEAICYSSNPSLPGTTNYALAKRYDTIDAAKDDIYRLRYHHREFLKIITVIKHISICDLELDSSLLSDTSQYQLSDLT